MKEFESKVQTLNLEEVEAFFNGIGWHVAYWNERYERRLPTVQELEIHIIVEPK